MNHAGRPFHTQLQKLYKSLDSHYHEAHPPSRRNLKLKIKMLRIRRFRQLNLSNSLGRLSKSTEGGCHLSSVAIQGREVDVPGASQGNIWVHSSAEDAREKGNVSTVAVAGATPEELLEKAIHRWGVEEGTVIVC